MRRCADLLLLIVLTSSPAWAQPASQPVPQPFPRSTGPQTPTPPTTVAVPRPQGAPAGASEGAAPTDASLGLPIFPSAQFLTSYDAGQGQRYYIFGSTATFAELVTYYRNVLKQRGELVFDEPATHMFEVGRFREESMAFPPGVTIKDYTWGNLGGYSNPKAGAQPARFPSVIQIVPVAAGDR